MITFLIFSVVGLVLLNPSAKEYLAFKFSYSQCDQPIKYRVDTVDPKFNLSKEAFGKNVASAASIWAKAYGKDIFVYDSQGELSINLIYDERQSLNTKINQLEDNLSADREGLDPRIEEYKRLSSEFKQKLNSFNQIVSDWNSKGGAPAQEYEKLLGQQAELKQESQRLNQMAKSLSQSAQDYNSQVVKLNETVESFNEAIELRPEEGIYKPDSNRIEIFFNISQAELIHTITHELGHVLAMEHNPNPKSIMYSKTNQQLIPTLEDLDQLKEACRRHSVVERTTDYYVSLVRFYQQSFLNQ